MRDAVHRDRRKNFHPAANHVKNGYWGQGKIGKRVFAYHEANGDERIDDFDDCGGGFWGVGFCSCKWLWKGKSTEAVLAVLRDTRVGYVRVERRLPEDAVVRMGSGDEGEEGGTEWPALTLSMTSYTWQR